jgi:hypothetical protein
MGAVAVSDSKPKSPERLATSATNQLQAPEAKALTHDGYIWPVPRHDMRDAETIIERMAEDFALVVKSENRVTLAGFGWLPDQLTRYRPAAAALYKRQQPQTNGFAAKTRSFAAGAAELACLTTFISMVGVWAIILGA